MQICVESMLQGMILLPRLILFTQWRTSYAYFAREKSHSGMEEKYSRGLLLLLEEDACVSRDDNVLISRKRDCGLFKS